MATSVRDVQEQLDAIQPYSMHVSSRYLELTQRKLQQTRLPREIELEESRRWDLGTPKGVLEPLLDYWLERYDWRTQESHLNTTLPQFRTSLPVSTTRADPENTTQNLRIHFVHKPSQHKNAIPLLFIHNWPSSFIEVSKIIDALTDPQSMMGFGVGAGQAFHVVAPSIPGFGFSDAGTVDEFGVNETAEVFRGLMARLGYERFVAHGSGWGFEICRALALKYPSDCLAVHITNPTFKEPDLKRAPMLWMKHRVACWTKAKISFLSFGYTPAEVVQQTTSMSSFDISQGPMHAHSPAGTILSPLYALRPQTLAYSLCDSPIGLLGAILDIIHTRTPSLSPVTSRSQSPFLSLEELEMEASSSTADNIVTPSDDNRRRKRREGGFAPGGGMLDHIVEEETSPTTPTPDDIHPSSPTIAAIPFSPHSSEHQARAYTWTPTEILNWTMLYWLPGPEASLRWLRRATIDTAPSSSHSTSYCPVPLGISSFKARGESASPLMWGEATWSVQWVKRHSRGVGVSAAWEAPDLFVLDLRECFGGMVADGVVRIPMEDT